MSESDETDLIVVLGMHRSGTSAITRGIRVLGADFGDNLQPAVAGINEKGFFEDNDIVALNAGAALWAAGVVDDVAAGLALARERLRSGAANERLAHFVAVTTRLAA